MNFKCEICQEIKEYSMFLYCFFCKTDIYICDSCSKYMRYRDDIYPIVPNEYKLTAMKKHYNLL